MSDFHENGAQGLEFARQWEALIAKGIEDAKANEKCGITVVDLADYDAEELGYPVGSNWKKVSGTVPTQVAVSNAAEEENEEPVVLTDNPKDKDYIPSEDDEDEEEARPKAFNAMKLTSAKKRKNRPFAPPERHAKKKSGPSSSKLIDGRTTAQPASWYADNTATKRYTRSQVQNLRYLRALIFKVQEGANQTSSDMPNLLAQLRARLSEIAFYDNMSAALVQESRLLDDGGLSDIFNNKGLDFPQDLCADAQAQYHKWLIGDFDPDLFRGIEYKRHTLPDRRVRMSRNLENGYKFKLSAAYVGNGALTNGQWWPLQICLLRDGAHGATEGGISGVSGGVAHSIIVSNSEYADIDEGDQIEYCGTSGRNKTPTLHTKMLLESVRRKSAVRVIRSSAAKTSTYLPQKGLRYDGLYDVIGYSVLDIDTAMYRFTLIRQQGQGEIRYKGESARPNEQELRTYGQLRQQFGLPA